ncbi:MAG: electron transfer flavoprotein subunit beta/FixA family protein [Pirellulales bacterium]
MIVKILVTVKRVPDTDQKIRVRNDAPAIDTASLPFVVNPFDAIAAEEAIRIAEVADHMIEVVVVTIGTVEAETELRTALAMGADRGLLIRVDQAVDPIRAAKILAAVVRRETPDLVLMGKQAVDDDANQTGQMLAGLLDWPQATFASGIDVEEDALTVERETDDGRETVRIGTPAVVTCDLRLNEPRYASVAGIMKARRKPVEEVTCLELGVDAQPAVEIVAFEPVVVERTCVRVRDVAELLDRLRHDNEER